jgi:hypothetical protein
VVHAVAGETHRVKSVRYPAAISSHFSPTVGLTRFRGHFPKGGYDVHDGNRQTETPGPSTIR